MAKIKNSLQSVAEQHDDLMIWALSESFLNLKDTVQKMSFLFSRKKESSRDHFFPHFLETSQKHLTSLAGNY